MLPQSYRSLLRARASAQVIRPSFTPVVSRITSIRYASQDYGSGSGDPVGENPQKQGGNPSSDAEHPGPPPPDVGQKDAGATTHADQGQSSGSSSSPSQSSSQGGNQQAGQSDPSNSDAPHNRSAKNGAQPKFNTAPPDTDSEDVKKHNREVDERRKNSRAHENEEGDKVGKGFWAGQGGRDGDP